MRAHSSSLTLRKLILVMVAKYYSSSTGLVFKLQSCACLQVTRKWLNWEGDASVQHIAALIQEMEEDPRVQRALWAKS